MKKRILACIVFMAVLCTAFPVLADGTTKGKCGENLTWIYDYSTNMLTISGTGDMSSYTYSSRAPWYSFIDNLVSVSIESGVTSIGDYAFYWCYELKNITIPNSVTRIGKSAFYECRELTDITIPNGTESIGEDAFNHCNGLKEVTVPGSVKSIGDGAFSDCYEEERDDNDNIIFVGGMEKVIIQYGVESICDNAFSGCKKLTDITLPDSVTSIGDNAFYNTAYYNDESKWENTVLYIGNHLIKADEWALNQAISEKTISSDYVVKSRTKSIADCAFYYCKGLTSITIPDSTVSIGNRAFDICSSLNSIIIPKSVTSIGDYAFQACVDLTDISVDPANTAYCDEDGVLYNKEKTKIMRFPTKNKKWKTSFIIPNSVTSIADGAFERCWNLTDIAIPGSVKSIGNSAFESCEKLTSITIPDSVTGIGDSALLGCSSLTKVIIPDGVTEIGYRTFYNCSDLTSVTIPNNVQIVDKEAFEKCTNLQQVYYIGSETDWKNEVIGDGKYVLTNIGITYLSGISARRSEDGNIVVKPINIAAGKTVILALYDGDKFVEMQSSIYGGTDIPFATDKAYTCAKVMIWNSLSEMSPVCDFKIVK